MRLPHAERIARRHERPLHLRVLGPYDEVAGVPAGHGAERNHKGTFGDALLSRPDQVRECVTQPLAGRVKRPRPAVQRSLRGSPRRGGQQCTARRERRPIRRGSRPRPPPRSRRESWFWSFLGRGFGGTTIRQVAQDAGVSQETIYKTFGGKAALLKSVYDVSLVGDEDGIPLAGRPEALGG